MGGPSKCKWCCYFLGIPQWSLCAHDPTQSPKWAQITLTRAPVFYLMLGLSRPVIDAGPLEAAALTVFKTTYLSYECFIQDSKYELGGWEPPQEHWGVEESCMLIMAEQKRKTGSNHILSLLASVFPSVPFFWVFVTFLSITENSCCHLEKFCDKVPKTEKSHEQFWLNQHSNRSILLTWETWGIVSCCSDTMPCRIWIQAWFINITFAAVVADKSCCVLLWGLHRGRWSWLAWNKTTESVSHTNPPYLHSWSDPLVPLLRWGGSPDILHVRCRKDWKSTHPCTKKCHSPSEIVIHVQEVTQVYFPLVAL